MLVLYTRKSGIVLTCKDTTPDNTTETSLEEDRVLDGSKGWLLDPHFAVEDLSNDIPSVVVGNPWFVFVAVG